MNGFFLCSAVALNLLSAPGGQVVGTVPLTNKFKSWMSVHFATFVGKPGPDGVSPRGWVAYGGLGQCNG